MSFSAVVPVLLLTLWASDTFSTKHRPGGAPQKTDPGAGRAPQGRASDQPHEPQIETTPPGKGAVAGPGESDSADRPNAVVVTPPPPHVESGSEANREQKGSPGKNLSPSGVEAKLTAARRAVAAAIVACEDAGLVESSIDPPPILDILITGRATDGSALKAKAGVSPEVFGAWFTGFGKPGMNIVPQNDVRIIQPSNGLKVWYEKRARFLNSEIEAVRKQVAGKGK